MNSTRALGGTRLARQARVVGPARRSLVVRAGADRVTQSKSDIIVSPSILSADFSKLGEQVRASAIPGRVAGLVTFASRAVAPAPLPQLRHTQPRAAAIAASHGC